MYLCKKVNIIRDIKTSLCGNPFSDKTLPRLLYHKTLKTKILCLHLLWWPIEMPHDVQKVECHTYTHSIGCHWWYLLRELYKNIMRLCDQNKNPEIIWIHCWKACHSCKKRERLSTLRRTKVFFVFKLRSISRHDGF